MADDRTALMSARALSPGYEILWYTIDRVLGQGGFGITYLAHDRNLDRAVAIKEYLPTTFAYRHEDYSVKPITGDHRENFVWGLGSFLKEAQTLARFSHPNVVRVHSVFEENNTAYMVMEYEHGNNLAALYKQQPNLDQQFFEQTFFPIFDGLKEIHKFEFIHRDIKPANIYIREDGTPVLIDFGSARQTTQQQTSEITTLVSQGYTPLEQYSANYGDQGPWTDIYALAATIYEGIVGKKPDESLSRSACLMRAKPDLLERLDSRVYTGFQQQFLDAVFAGLKLEPEGRPQSLEQWSDLFANGISAQASPSAIESSGFTELEDDRTRIQPRRKNPATIDPDLDFDTFDDLSSQSTRTVAPQSYQPDSQPIPDAGPQAAMDAGRHTGMDTGRTAFTGTGRDTYRDPMSGEYQTPPKDSYQSVEADPRQDLDAFDTDSSSAGLMGNEDLLAFDDDDLDTDSRIRGNRKASVSKTAKPSGKKPVGMIAASVLVAALGAGGVFYFLNSGGGEQKLSLSALNELPMPPQSVQTRLPEEGAIAQLDKMMQLAKLLTQAHAMNPSDTNLLNNIRSTEADLLALAKQWNAGRHPNIASKISAVSQALPQAVHDRVRIQRILAASGQVSVSAQILALMDDKHYLAPAGESVLDRITAASNSDIEQLKTSSQWNQMMGQFKDAAMQKLSQSDFDGAAKLTEVALTMDSGDTEFNALRQFLARQ